MKARIDLHNKLVEALGSKYVYFQPPPTLRLYQGNRIVYSMDDLALESADNTKYIGHARYSVTLITKDPDWVLIRELPFLFDHCSFDRSFATDGLNHYVYTIYY